MAELAKAMWRQATHDLDHAERALASGDFDWACLAAQQAAEKALKAVLLHSGLPANPLHNLSRLYDALIGAGVTDRASKAELQTTSASLPWLIPSPAIRTPNWQRHRRTS